MREMRGMRGQGDEETRRNYYYQLPITQHQTPNTKQILCLQVET